MNFQWEIVQYWITFSLQVEPTWCITPCLLLIESFPTVLGDTMVNQLWLIFSPLLNVTNAISDVYITVLLFYVVTCTIFLMLLPAQSFWSLSNQQKLLLLLLQSVQNDLWMFPGHKSRDGQPIDPNILLAHHPKNKKKKCLVSNILP